jgi:hypothetical protein
MSAARLDFRNHRLPSALLAVLFVISMTNSVRSAWDLLDEMLYGDQYVSAGFDLDTQTFEVEYLEPGAEHGGLQMGDVVVGVNGRPVQGWSDIWGPVRRARTGDHLLLQIKRTGAAGSVGRDISVPLRQFTHVGYAPGRRRTWSRFFPAS